MTSREIEELAEDLVDDIESYVEARIQTGTAGLSKVTMEKRVTLEQTFKRLILDIKNPHGV